MALTNLHTNWDFGSYYDDLDNFIKQQENVRLLGGDTSYLAPYYDGSIAIGYGFDLLVRSDAEINKFFADAGLSTTLSDTDKVLLATARACVASSKTTPPGLSAADLQTTLKNIANQLVSDLNLGSEPNATALLDTYIAQKADTQVTTFLKKWTGADWGDCKERIALVSLAYNSPKYLGNKLGAAIASGNRAEAWYEIRYDSNINGPYASRRYSEAAEFGLYDNATAPSLDESKSVYRMFTAHRDNILGYENQYPPTGTGQTIRDQLGLACATILGDIAIGTAATHNEDIANAYAAWVSGGNDPSTFDPTKLFLGNDLGTAVDARQYTVPGVMGNEVASNDIVLAGDQGVNAGPGYMLMGGLGNDLIIGGNGNDVLVGGGDNDVMAGGAGNDIYVVQGGSTVTIEDKQGANTLLIDGKSIGYFYSLDGVSYVSNVNGFTAVLQSGDFIINYIDPANGQVTQVTLNKNFQSGDFGINLIDSQTIPPSTVTPDYTINGDQTPLQYTDSNGNIYYKTDANGNLITDGTSNPNFNDVLFGDGGNDVINTGGGNNLVNGMGGNDTINGGSGNDFIVSGNVNSNNQVFANDSWTGAQIGLDPTLNYYQNYGGNGNNVINGGGGQDVIIVGNGNNQIYAGTQIDLSTALTQRDNATATGNKGDLIAVGDGSNTIVGSNGNDAIFTGTGNNTLVLGPGSESVMGGVEINAASLSWTEVNNTFSPVGGGSAAYTAPSPYNGSTFDGVPVGVGNDTIFGGTGDSQYWLSNGNNWLDAGGGNDFIQAGVGKNTIYGGLGNDTIWGGGGSNYINLESGSDTVVLNGGNNTVIGGTGNDTISSGDTGTSWADSETSANNYIYGGAGDSVIYGSGGNDTLIGGTGNATINGGNGNEYIVGGSGNVSINGGNGTDTIYAGDGNSIIWAGDGNTSVYGGNGSDTIVGGTGTDVLSAGDGGTVAAPTYVFSGNGTTSIYGGAGVDFLTGGTGNDLMVAGTGTSTLQGGSGTETMYGSIGNAMLIAGSGSDTLYGGSGTDVLQGSTGNTLFVAGSGNETIQGGTGNNTYEFDSGFGNVELQNTQAADTFNFGAGISVSDLDSECDNGKRWQFGTADPRQRRADRHWTAVWMARSAYFPLPMAAC